MKPSEAVSQLRTTAGFSVPQPTAQQLIHERHSRLAVESKWSRGVVDLGPTVLDQADYLLPDTVAYIEHLTLGTDPLVPEGLESLGRIRGGSYHQGARGVFAEGVNADGLSIITLSPTPVEVQTLTAVCVIDPGAGIIETDAFTIPSDFHRAIVEGAIADLLRMKDENWRDAAAADERFEAAVQRLSRRRNARGRPGPFQAKVAGYTGHL